MHVYRQADDRAWIANRGSSEIDIHKDVRGEAEEEDKKCVTSSVVASWEARGRPGRESRDRTSMGNLPIETPPENTGGQKGHHRDHLDHGFLSLSRDPIS